MRNAKLWSVLLATMLVCACVVGVLFTGASASDTRIPTATTTYVVGTDGDTIRACLDKAAAETWAAGTVLEIRFSGEDDSIYESPDPANGISGYLAFETRTIFREDDTKLPIVIRGTDEDRAATLKTAQNGYSFTNDYFFTDLTFGGGASGKSVSFYAGCGEIVFENTKHNNAAYTYYFGDNQCMDTYIGWDEAKINANKNEKGLLVSGITFGEGVTGLVCADENGAKLNLPAGYNDMHLSAVGFNGSAACNPVLTSMRQSTSTTNENRITEPLSDTQVEAARQAALEATFQPGNVLKECAVRPWDTSAYMILDCGRVATQSSTAADYEYAGARKGISPVREARLEMLSGGAQYLSATAHNSSYNETYVGDTTLIIRGGRAGGYGDVGIRLTNECMHIGNLTFEIHEDDPDMPSYTPWIQAVANSSDKETRIFGDYYFLMTGGTIGKANSSTANGYYGAPQATGKIVNEVRGGMLWNFSTVRYGSEYVENTPISIVLPGTGEVLTAKVAVHNIISGGTFGGVNADGAVIENTGFFAGSRDGGDANTPPSVCNEITGGTFYRFAVANRTFANNFPCDVYNLISGTEEKYPTFLKDFHGASSYRTTRSVTNVFKGCPRFEDTDGTKRNIFGGTTLGTVTTVNNYLAGMPVFNDFYGGGSGAAWTYKEDGVTVNAYNNTICGTINNVIALDPTETAITNYIWGGNGYYAFKGVDGATKDQGNSKNGVTGAINMDIYSGTFGTLRNESTVGTDKCNITLNVYGGTWKSNFMAVNRTYGPTDNDVKNYTVFTNIYDGIFEGHMYMGGQNSRNQAIVNNVYGGQFSTKFTNSNGYAYYGSGQNWALSVENNIYGGTFYGVYYGAGYHGAGAVTNNIYGATFGPWHDFMGARIANQGYEFDIVNNFYGGDTGNNWLYGGNRSGACKTITNNFFTGAENPVRDPENELFKYFDAEGKTTMAAGTYIRDQVVAGSGYEEETYSTNTVTGIVNNLEGGLWTGLDGGYTYITFHGGMRWGIVKGDIKNNVVKGKYHRMYGGSDYGVIEGDIINTIGKPLAEGEEAPELVFCNTSKSVGYFYGGGMDGANFQDKIATALGKAEENRTAAQKMYAALGQSLEEGDVYNASVGNIVNTIYYGDLRQFNGGALGLMTAGVTTEIASITNNVYGGTFTDTKIDSTTNHAYFGGCARNAEIAGGIVNNIYGGEFLTNYYGGSPGSGVVVCPTVENNIYGGTGHPSSNRQFFMGNGAATYNGTVHSVFYAASEQGPGFEAKRTYIYGGCSNVHNDTDAEIEVLTEIYGGTFSGVWGIGGGSGTNFKGTVKTVVYGGTFNEYQEGMPNALMGATRNGTMNGNAILEIYGGTFDGDVVGGVVYGHDDSAADLINGNLTVNIYGGEFLENIYPVARPGANVALAEGKTAVVNGEQVADKALTILGKAVFDTFKANGEAITIGASTDIEIKALTGEIAFEQTEGWQAHDYVLLPAGSVYTVTTAQDAYGSYTADETVLISGKAVASAGATIRLAERLGVRIVLNPDDVDAYGDVFTYTVKMGDVTLAEGGYDELKANGYSILFDGIGLAQFDEKFTVTSPVMKNIEYSIVDLAVMAQTAWAENAKWKAYADAIVEFDNVYNKNQENTLTPDAVTLVPSAALGELGSLVDQANSTATLLMSDAAGIRMSVALTEAPASAKFVVGGKEFDATIERTTVSADVFFAHEALADEFTISVQNAEGQVYLTYTASIEAMASKLANDEANENKDNAQAFLVYVQKAVACK